MSTNNTTPVTGKYARTNIYFPSKADKKKATRQAKSRGFRSLSGYLAYLMRRDEIAAEKEAIA